MTSPAPIIAPGLAAGLDPVAHDLALLDDAAIDRIVDDRVAAAVRGHRIDEAVYWQRVRLRAHRLRVRATTACRA